jgi:hypothetical protein
MRVNADPGLEKVENPYSIGSNYNYKKEVPQHIMEAHGGEEV